MSLIAYKHTQISSTVPLPEDLCRLKKHKAKPFKISIDVNPRSDQQTTWKSHLDWFQNYHRFWSTYETWKPNKPQTAHKELSDSFPVGSLSHFTTSWGFKKFKKKKELMCYIHFLNTCWCFSAWSSKQGVVTVTNRQGRAGKNHMEFSTKGQKLGGVEFKKPATTMASPSILSSTQIETGMPSWKHSDSTREV